MSSRRPDGQGRPMPDKKAIYQYWADHHLAKYMNWDYRDEAIYGCMACGASGGDLHRAHILPLWQGGSNLPSNLHILCKTCHSVSEDILSVSYWAWIALKSNLYRWGTDVTYEVDDGSMYHYEAEWLDKLKTYQKDYWYLRMVSEWGYSPTQTAVMIAAGIMNTETELPCLDEVFSIDECPNMDVARVTAFNVELMYNPHVYIHQ
jgi:hypothetical protein